MSVYMLMNGDRPVLTFDFDDMYIHVENNIYLPYMLKDFIRDTSLSTRDDIKKSMRDISCVKDFLSGRVLSLSRENAKAILNSSNLPQSLKTEERLKIVIACRALNMEDNFWLKKEGEDISYSEVDLRKHRLSEKSYDIAILGHTITATAEELIPDLTANGMFPKFWRRSGAFVELWKTDKAGGINSRSEVMASKYIREAGGCVVDYRLENTKDYTFSVSKCMTDSSHSLIHAQDVIDWCIHTGQNFMEFISNGFSEEFANMCVADYVLANTDRHSENWGFMVDNGNNSISGFAPLYDLNQSLIADEFGTDIDDLPYEPSEKNFAETVRKFAENSTIDFDRTNITGRCKSRWQNIQSIREQSKISEDLER